MARVYALLGELLLRDAPFYVCGPEVSKGDLAKGYSQRARTRSVSWLTTKTLAPFPETQPRLSKFCRLEILEPRKASFKAEV